MIHDYVSIGDHGKLVLPLRKELGMRGRVWVVHEDCPDEIPAVLERGSTGPVGEHVPIEYHSPGRLSIPDECADLVTINQGLHHLPQGQLMGFLIEVRRILRPGGVFIVREHDATPELIPMLDLAHSVFNVVTGVSSKDERQEIRAFRPVSEWRRIVAAAGFGDSLIYEMQADDPTLDEMMAFYKPPFRGLPPAHTREEQLLTASAAMPIPAPPVFPGLTAMVNKVPEVVLEILKAACASSLAALPAAAASAEQFASSSLSPGFSSAASMLIDNMTRAVTDTISKFEPMLKEVQLQDTAGTDLVPPELFLIVPALEKKFKAGHASSFEQLAYGIATDIQRMVTVNVEDTLDTCSPEEELQMPSRTVADVEMALEELIDAIQGLLNGHDIVDGLQLPMYASNAVSSILSGYMDSEGEPALPRLAHTLHLRLDEQAWAELQVALADVASAQDMPTIEKLTANYDQPNVRHPWCSAALALFGSPLVTFSRSQSLQASFIGLGSIVRLWKFAQDQRLAANRAGRKGNGIASALGDLQEPSEVTIVMEDGDLRNVHNVGNILYAEWGYDNPVR